MKISGFSFVRNAVTFDYPSLESISSILPLCDEFVIAVGNSSDDTLQKLKSLNSPKIKLIETVWDESLRTGGQILAQQTNIALDHVSGDWAFYLQADEVAHENDFEKIRNTMLQYETDKRVEGILFSYKHFYGSYRYIGTSRQWYRNEIRIIRTNIGVRSWGDAQGFRIDGRKLRVKPVDATIYHYGWVKPPEKQQAKQESFNRLWHSDEWMKQHIGSSSHFDYNNGTKLTHFTDSHPAVMRDRIKNEHWNFEYDESKVREPLKDKVLGWIETKTRLRIGEYKNYEVIE